ncbi:MAG: c-type cytochrome [Steroidobacteraceae bacterium]
MSKQDTHFFNVFSVVIGLLTVIMLVIFALARHVGATRQAALMKDDPLVMEQTQARTALPVRVAVAGQDNSALVIAPVTATPAVSTALVVPTNGDEVYEQVCKACHGLGIAGAPKAGDAAAWASRRAEGKATLYEHALKGYTGTAGVMPAKGGRTDLSDELIKAGLDHMLAM